MLIDEYERTISQFEKLLQKITANMTNRVLLEKLSPEEVWKRSEGDVTSLQELTGKLKELMLTLKPEKAVNIETRALALSRPLDVFRETLFRKSNDPISDSVQALEELSRGVIEGSSFLDLSKEIKNNPSASIVEILKLKEVHDTKEYLSAIPVPKVTYVRFRGLKKDIENLRLSISNLERSFEELKHNLSKIMEDLSKFRPEAAEVLKETGSEPNLVSDQKD